MSTSKEYPIELVDTVTLTCNEDTSETVSEYGWYHNGKKITNKITKSFEIGNTRTKDGHYQCDVTTAIKTSTKSAVKNVRFLCKCIASLYVAVRPLNI